MSIDRYMKYFVVTILSLLFTFSVLFAQDDYKKWLEEQNKKYQEYKDKKDKAFVDFLQQEWKKMQMMQGFVPDENPKPDEFPVAEQIDTPQQQPGYPKVKIDIELPDPGTRKQPEFKPVAVDPAAKEFVPLEMSFYGTDLHIMYDKNILVDFDKKVDKQAISDFWAILSRSDYEPLVSQIEKLRSKMYLNDWGFCTLLYQIGSKMYQKNQNQSVLITWFLLTKFGYDVKVGYYEDEIFLLIPTKQLVYGLTFFTIAEKNYYVVSFSKKDHEINTLFTYDGSYPDAKKIVDLRIDDSPHLGIEISKKELNFNYFNDKYSIPVRFNNNVIEFYKTYPLTDLTVYFYSTPSTDAKYSLLMNLKPILEGKSELESVNILLRFVQTAFQYKTDKEQKPMAIAPVVKEVLKMLRSSLPASIEIRQSIDK